MRLKTLKEAKSSLRLLKKWKIKTSKHPKHQGQISFNRKKRIATIYPFHDKDPELFCFHECLHAAIVETLNFDDLDDIDISNKQEILVQDICRIVKYFMEQSKK